MSCLPARRWRPGTVWAFLGWIIVAASLSACTVQLVSPYDEVIDRGVTEFSDQFLFFVARMNREAGTAEGTYAENVKFYEQWSARLETLAERALATEPTGSCPGNETFGGIVQEGFEKFTAEMQIARPDEPERPEGGCTAQLLQYLKLQFGDFEEFHKAQGDIGIPVQARAPVTLMQVTIQAVMYVELRKKQS